MHKASFKTDPTNSFFIEKIKAGLRKTLVADRRIPITHEMLLKILQAVDYTADSKYLALMFKALFSLMFHAFLRIGEVTHSPHNISYNNIVIDHKTVAVTFVSFKHHVGDPVTVVIATNPSKSCPVKLLNQYLALRGKLYGPLFCMPGAVAVTPGMLREMLRRSTIFAKLPSQLIKPHSFRIGAATQAASKGASDQQIRSLGRWKSDAYKKYIRNLQFSIPSSLMI